MLTSRLTFTLLATLLLVSACERNATTASPAVAAAAPTAPTLAAINARPAAATVSAGAANTSFALVASSCAQKPCAAEIELVANGQRLDAVALQFAASSANLVAKPDDASFATVQALTTYIAGEEEGAVATVMQPVRLSAQRAGLLVQQAAGFEHVKRRRDVFIVDDKKLKRVWSKQDGSGPVRSYADVIAAGPNADEIVLIEGSSFTPNQADQITALRLVWDEAANTLRETPVPVMAALVVGDFATAEAARAQYADACFANYWLLRADQVGEKSKRFVLALLTPDAAVPAFNALPDCSPKAMRRVAQFRPNNEKK